MCSEKQKGYTTAQKKIHRFVFDLFATVKKKEKKGDTTRVEPVPLQMGGNALHVYIARDDKTLTQQN